MFFFKQSYSGLGDPRLQRQQSFSATDMLGGIFDLFFFCCFLHSPLKLKSYPFE